MADNGSGPAGTTELLERVQQLESCLRQAEYISGERAAELELARRRVTDQAAEQYEEAERQRESVQRLQSELDGTLLRMELEKLCFSF